MLGGRLTSHDSGRKIHLANSEEPRPALSMGGEATVLDYEAQGVKGFQGVICRCCLVYVCRLKMAYPFL